MKRYITFLIVVIILVHVRSGIAFNENYPPFDIKIWENRTLKVLPVIKGQKGEFKDRNVTIRCSPQGIEEYRTIINIEYANKLVSKIVFPLSKDDPSILSEIYYVDIDKNELSDIIIGTTNLGTGLGAFDNHIIILFQTVAGKFRRLDFNTFYFDIKDFVNLKEDGKYELLMMQLAQIECSDGKLHDFWVYIPYKIKDFNLILSQNIHTDFPKFIWFTKKHNDKPTGKLSQKEKDNFIKTLSSMIKSREP